MKTKTKKPTQAQLRRAFERAKNLSTILAIGLHDLALVERSKRYVVDMETWCRRRDGKCAVCLAGAVMAGRYKDIVERELADAPQVFPSDCDISVGAYVLDNLRVGCIALAAKEMQINLGDFDDLRTVVDYDVDRHGWWRDMRRLLKDLRAAGL